VEIQGIMAFLSRSCYWFPPERMKMREKNLRKMAVGLILSVVVFGCSFHNDKMGQQNGNSNSIFVDVNGRITLPAGKAPGYNTVKSLVFQKNCIECHGNTRSAHGINLETYAATKKAASRISDAIFVDQTMPPRKALPFEEQQLIRAWIDAGAPEEDVNVSTGEPLPSATPEPTPVPTATPEPTATPVPTPFGIIHFADVDAQVITPRCIKCHNDTRSAHGINLQGYDNVMKNLKGVEDEALIRLSMPPKNKPLLTEEQTLLRAWIDQGALK
jgi:uncharacterized membrane protein